ncbi:hypothetical protein Q8A67_009499 [Cirrhinus molitorella]|uniref:Uncharacterized protein n=1 Tax=Cirrhinus molitorella TaxID=172907 RepID=A0AA88TQK0_9TELE|nr:hypothetical protein Q8A67_009499 [Cirrhinus molitorella]
MWLCIESDTVTGSQTADTSFTLRQMLQKSNFRDKSAINKTHFSATVFCCDFTALHYAGEKGVRSLRANRLLSAGIEPMTEVELNADVLHGAVTLIRNWSLGMCLF